MKKLLSISRFKDAMLRDYHDAFVMPRELYFDKQDLYYRERRRYRNGRYVFDTETYRDYNGYRTRYDEPPFWETHGLVKHLAGEKDEEGEDIFVYSIVDKSNYTYSQRLPTYEEAKDWVRKLPHGLFEEVADNWFELLVAEEDLKTHNIKVLSR